MICFPEPRKTEYRFSSHQDLLPTILDYMQVDGVSDVILGKSLLKYSPENDFALSSQSIVNSQVSLQHMVIGDEFKVQFKNDGPMVPEKVYSLDHYLLKQYPTERVTKLLEYANKAKGPTSKNLRQSDH